jgi:hypothetical protein
MEIRKSVVPFPLPFAPVGSENLRNKPKEPRTPRPIALAGSMPGQLFAGASGLYRRFPSPFISAFNQVTRAGPKQIATPTGIAITPQMDKSPFKKDKIVSITTRGLPCVTGM